MALIERRDQMVDIDRSYNNHYMVNKVVSLKKNYGGIGLLEEICTTHPTTCYNFKMLECCVMLIDLLFTWTVAHLLCVRNVVCLGKRCQGIVSIELMESLDNSAPIDRFRGSI